MYNSMSSAICVAIVQLALAITACAQEDSPILQAQHGTCAIALATQDNMAVIVDSKLTRLGSNNSCVEKNAPGCKAILVRKDVMLIVTGIFNDPTNGSDWKVGDETKKLLSYLPPKITMASMDDFNTKWFTVLTGHYRRKQNLSLNPGATVSTLLVITRIDGLPYVYKENIWFNADGRFQEEGTFLRVSRFPTLMYAGSCRDNVGTNPLGMHHLAADPPNRLYQWELDEIGQRKEAARSVEEFGPLLREYEVLFEKIGDSENKCWIGPPYDVATWAKGAEGWSTNFKANCRPKQSSVSPSARHSHRHLDPKGR
jgi:hypothetical protein